MSQSWAKEMSGRTVLIMGAKNKGRTRPDSAARMRSNNPMNDPSTLEKMRSSMSGRTFLARGGNGQLTVPQINLSEALGWPTEYPIETATVADRFDSLPHAYKVDIANPDLKLAIEVDGNSHRSRKWRFLDRRKEEVLAALGWTVLRFPNELVLGDLDLVVKEVTDFMNDPEAMQHVLEGVLARAMANRPKARKAAS
jgi:hypothetical protein